jgi:hypothetical protein
MSWDPKQTPHERPAKPSSVLKISYDARQEAMELRERALARQEASIQRARAVAHAGFRDTQTMDGSGIHDSRADGRIFAGNPSLHDDHRFNVALDDDPYDLFREPKVYYCSPHASPPRESPPREQPRTLRPFEVTDYHGVRHMCTPLEVTDSTTPYPLKDRSALGFGWGELSAGSPGLGNGKGGSSFRSGTSTGVGERVKRPVDSSTQGSPIGLAQSLGRKEMICGGSATRVLADPPTVDQVPSSRPPRLDVEVIGRVGQGGQAGSAGQLNSGMEAGWLVQKHKY